MFAIIATGGKQYKVAPNDIIEVEKLPGKAGETVTLDSVLAIGAGSDLKIGSAIGGTVVTAEIIAQKKDDKIIVFKKKRRQNYRRKNGHRQQLTVLKVLELGGVAAPKKKTEKVEKAEPAAKAEKAETKAAAPKAAPKAAAKTEKPAAKKAPAKTAKPKAAPAAE